MSKKPAHEVILGYLDHLERQNGFIGRRRFFFGGEWAATEAIAETLLDLLAQMALPPEARRVIKERLDALIQKHPSLTRRLFFDHTDNSIRDLFKDLEQGYKPNLLDIARQAVVEDKDAGSPDDLMSTLEACWVTGAKSLGLTVIPYAEEIPSQLADYLVQPDRKLGDVVEHEGQRLMLIANMPSVPYAAFVPAEEVQL
jgi:hypothetical protein